MEYFTSVPISEHIIRICDPVAVAMYLVIGEKEAVLRDLLQRDHPEFCLCPGLCGGAAAFPDLVFLPV